MKTKKVILVVIVLLVLFSLASSIPREPIGSRIALYSAEVLKFPAGEPFHIRHGWYNPSDITGSGLFRFALEDNGEFVEDFFVLRSSVSGDPEYLNWIWVYNYPDGLSGTHTFTGHWYGSCQGLVEMEVFSGPCEKPNQIIETVRTRTVIFDEPEP